MTLDRDAMHHRPQVSGCPSAPVMTVSRVGDRRRVVDERKDQVGDSLSVTLGAILRGVIRRRIRIHWFAAPRETTGRGCRGLSLARSYGGDGVGVGSVGGSLGVLRNRETRSRPSVDVLINVGLLLRWVRVRVRVVWRQGGGHRGLLRSAGRWNRSDIVDVQVHVSWRLLRLLGLLWLLGLLGFIVALRLEGRSDSRKDGLNLCLERLS